MGVHHCQRKCLSLLPPGWWPWEVLCPSFRGYLHKLDVFLACSHYYNGNYYHHSTCDCCVLWNIPHHHDSYTCSQLCGPDNTGSAGCGSSATVNSEKHIKGSIIQEVDELFAMAATEPSSGEAGFFTPKMFVVPKHTGGLYPILNLK